MVREFILLVIAACGVLFLPACDQPSHAELAAVTEETLQANADDLSATIITPHLEQAITPGMNVLWCASFQLAWNEGAAIAGGRLDLDPPTPMADALNRQSVTKEDVPEGSTSPRPGAWTAVSSGGSRLVSMSDSANGPIRN